MLAIAFTARNKGGMNLDQYLNTHSVRASAFADIIGVSSATITRIRQGRQNIPLALASKIVQASGGKVTLTALAASLSTNDILPASPARGLGAGIAPDCDGDAVPAACLDQANAMKAGVK